ncbi:peptide deformylase [Candidatus Dojkabacteria bacterium]|nr:peptide deformylase [Candidatus Dojkabacteria bacterium]
MTKTLEIARMGEPVLRQKAQRVTQQELKTKEFQNFLDNLIDAMVDSDGVGIAAPQVFIGKRVFIMNRGNFKEGEILPAIVINPEFKPVSMEKAKGVEGCLSLPGLVGYVSRYKKIKIEYLDREGDKVSEIIKFPLARIYQHEHDHLEGVLWIDRALKDDIYYSDVFDKLVDSSR